MRYLLAIFGDEGGWDDVSPEELKAGMEPWNRFEQELREAGVKLAGDGLQPSGTAVTVEHGEGNEPVVTDGPFAETKEQLGGFYLLECDSADEAVEWARKMPVQPGRKIEVRPIMDYTEFGFEPTGRKAEAAS